MGAEKCLPSVCETGCSSDGLIRKLKTKICVGWPEECCCCEGSPNDEDQNNFEMRDRCPNVWNFGEFDQFPKMSEKAPPCEKGEK